MSILELELEISTHQSDLMAIVMGQQECEYITDQEWWDIWCVEDDSHHEVHYGSLEEFGARLVGLGWGVESLERFSAICPECQRKEDESHYAAQYQDGSGGLL